MKRFRPVASLLALALAAVVAGCHKSDKVDATKPLQQSFESAQPEVKDSIQTATTELQSGNYVEATRKLAQAIDGRPLNKQQRQAVGLALKQINQAVSANPSLDSKEMYQLRAKMFQAVYNGPRF